IVLLSDLNRSLFWLARVYCLFASFVSNDTATTEIYTLSLHDALPISALAPRGGVILVFPSAALSRAGRPQLGHVPVAAFGRPHQDRKSTRLNSSHVKISYAVFCLKKKKIISLLSKNYHLVTEFQ